MVVWETDRVNDAPQTAIESTLTALPALPQWLTVVLGVLAVCLAGLVYFRERGNAGARMRGGLALIRASLLLIVLWMLLGWSLMQYTTSRPEVVMVIDRSASMDTTDVGDSSAAVSRREYVVDSLKQFSRREELSQRYRTRWFWVADGVETADVDWLELDSLDAQVGLAIAQSRLGDALSRIVERQAGGGTAAIVFISDGINTAGRSLTDAGRAARLSTIPIYTVAVGRQMALPDLRVTDVLFERDIYLGDQGVIDLSVVATDAGAASTSIVLSDLQTGNVLDSTRVQFSTTQNQQTARLSFVPERAGEMELSISAEPVEGEQDLENNQTSISIHVQDRTIRVLMVFARPSYEFRFLKHLLERSKQLGDSRAAAFEVHCVLQEADAEYVLQDESAIRLVPSRESELAKYDAFILGDFDPRLVSRSAQSLIHDRVLQDGAGCIFVFGDGEPSRSLVGWALADLLPVKLPLGTTTRSPGDVRFHWDPTSIGAAALPLQLSASNGTAADVWSRLPSLVSLAKIDAIKPGAQVWATAGGPSPSAKQPLLVTQFAGSGRVAVQLTDETYRLNSLYGNDELYGRYWGQLLRWLTRGRLAAQQEAELTIQPRQSRYGEPVSVTLLAPKSAAGLPEIELILEDGQGGSQPLMLLRSGTSPRFYRTRLEDLPPGNYRAIWTQNEQVQRLSRSFSVSAPPSEQANLTADHDALRLVAEQSRGRFYEEDQIDRMLRELPEGRRTRLGALPPKPLWNHAWVGLGFMLLLTAEWLLRRRARML